MLYNETNVIAILAFWYDSIENVIENALKTLGKP